MRILFVSGETPLYPSGGIATYLDYMVPALRAAGHEVRLFTWVGGDSFTPPERYAPFRPEEVHIEWCRDDDVHRALPGDSFFHSLSFWLCDRIAAFADAHDVDVVEATDYQGPCLAYFQRHQSRAGAGRRLLSTYHHGLSEVIFEADQIRYPGWAVANNIAERQQMRCSDLVMVPSKAICARLRSLDVQSPVEIVREPFAFGPEPPEFEALRPEIQYIGRLSIQKGIDKLIYAANLLHTVLPLRKVELIGRVGFTTFRQNDIVKYIEDRLHPELRENFLCAGYRSRKAAMQLLEPRSISPHLGTDESFSYACIEAIDAGLLPIVRQGTAMAEFFPEDLQDFVLDRQMRHVGRLQAQFTRMIEEAPRILTRVREHCRATLDPAVIAEDMGQRYDKALAEKRGRRVHAVAQRPMGAQDVTVLIPAYKPGPEFMETVDSIAHQSAGVPQVLICDDGTPEDADAWFAYARARLPQAQILRQPNAGLLAARNTLIEACETELSLFLDTDDLLAPDLLARMLEAWNESPRRPDAILPQRANFGESREIVLRHLLEDHIHILQNDYRMTALIRTAILREIGFDATRRNGEGDDWIFWLDFAGRGHVGQPLPEAGFLYRFRTGSMSWPWSEGQHVGTQTMLRELIQELCQRRPEKSTALARALYTRIATK